MMAVKQACYKLHTLGTIVIYSETHPSRKCPQHTKSKFEAFSVVNTSFINFYYICTSKVRLKHQSNTLLLTVPQLNGEIQSFKMDGRSNTSEANTTSATASTLFKPTIKKWKKYTLWLLTNIAAYWRKHYDTIHATRSEKATLKSAPTLPCCKVSRLPLSASDHCNSCKDQQTAHITKTS